MRGASRSGFIIMESIVSLLLLTSITLPMGHQIFSQYHKVVHLKQSCDELEQRVLKAEKEWHASKKDC
ncbi:hypothetical protein JOC36_001350 [Weissella uvarum]|uniref:hypothetical protein n=1 Tax=Weissella uvarum TaxID=1479233 RepID=UPI001961F555|nr:hypothetical protein [Weissella uvarum]MBM7617773.1 hypothetical protein [Weissella uvarum]MCM0595848.1 hypothetical protein [Weissella uvarum]